MRAGCLALLVATGGCNAIFGLKDNLSERDASPYEGGIDAAWWPMDLRYQVMESPTGPIDYPPIPGATVAVGPIDPADGALQGLPVSPDGSFLVPSRPANQLYRLVYTVDALPTEIQSTISDGHFVVPMVGRIDRTATPSHALIEFAPVAAPGGTIQVRVLTVGLWTVSSFTAGNDLVSLPYTYDYQVNATSLNGPQGSLDIAHNDLEVITRISNGDVIGYAVDSVTGLNPNPPGPTAVAQGVWKTTPIESLKWKVPNGGGPLDPFNRMINGVPGYDPTHNVSASAGGVIPSTMMPNFLEPVPGGLDGLQLAPLSTTYELPHQFVNPFADPAGGGLPTAVYTQDTTYRMVGLVKLTSGFQGISPQTTGPAAVDMAYDVGFPHVLNRDITLTPAGVTAPVALAADGQMIMMNGARLADLSFETDRPVDDIVVTLYQVETTTLTPVRRLLMQHTPAMTPFRIDTSVFAAGKTYVFGIVCRKGQPGAQTGDFRTVSYPYQTSTLYTTTFSVVP